MSDAYRATRRHPANVRQEFAKPPTDVDIHPERGNTPREQGESHMEFSMRSTHEACLFRVTFQRVVPANAGTHTARNFVLALEQRPFYF